MKCPNCNNEMEVMWTDIDNSVVGHCWDCDFDGTWIIDEDGAEHNLERYFFGWGDYMKIIVRDNLGKDVTYERDWYINTDGKIFYETGDIDGPLYIVDNDYTFELVK